MMNICTISSNFKFFFPDTEKGIGMNSAVHGERPLPDPIYMISIHQTTSSAWLISSLTMQAMFRQSIC